MPTQRVLVTVMERHFDATVTAMRAAGMTNVREYEELGVVAGEIVNPDALVGIPAARLFPQITCGPGLDQQDQIDFGPCVACGRLNRHGGLLPGATCTLYARSQGCAGSGMGDASNGLPQSRPPEQRRYSSR